MKRLTTQEKYQLTFVLIIALYFIVENLFNAYINIQ